MFATPANFEDVQKYFKGCYIVVNEDLFLVDKVQKEAIFCSSENDSNFIIELDGVETKQEGYNLNFPLPQKSWFQINQHAFFLSRIPARMWKKGISKENTTIVHLDDRGKIRAGSVSFSTLKSYISPKTYFSYRELQNHNSIALNSRFALSFNGDVYLDNSCIAKYNKNDNVVVTPTIYFPEISALFQGCKVLCL